MHVGSDPRDAPQSRSGATKVECVVRRELLSKRKRRLAHVDDDGASWAAEVSHAAAVGVRLFGVCTDGSDLLEGVTTLGKSTGDEGAGRGSTTVNMVLGSSRGGAPAACKEIGY